MLFNNINSTSNRLFCKPAFEKIEGVEDLKIPIGFNRGMG